MAAKLGLKPQYVTQDFSSLLASVNNRQFDVAAASIAITKVREQLVDFTNGYLVGYLGVMAPPGAGITSRTSLAGKRVAVMQGTIEDTYAPTYIPARRSSASLTLTPPSWPCRTTRSAATSTTSSSTSPTRSSTPACTCRSRSRWPP